ncbi:MAG: STAS-like domain-containing protein [Lachnospiraceae bacterium]|nr:STAS-like domain-containing protein [Lachnospiraceae bacterium]
MSLTQKKRAQIKQYILEKIGSDGADIAAKCAEACGLSLNSIYRYIRQMEADGEIVRRGRRLYLRIESRLFSYQHSRLALSFDTTVFEQDIRPLLSDCAENVLHIWSYAVSEMVNNIIDHSDAEIAQALVLRDAMNTTIILRDDGIGIFRKIQTYFQFPDMDEAIAALFKGKLTTDTENHSGEGIFFTSRAVDLFAVLSGGKIFSHDDYDDIQKKIGDVSDLAGWEHFPGTVVFMRLANRSPKRLVEIFDAYTDAEGSFNKTGIVVSRLFPAPVSRSQARRLAERLEQFKTVELDFRGVDWIGQGFAHELFVVWQRRHPEIRLVVQNENNDVRKMIHHVTAE